MAVESKTVTARRKLRFDSLDEMLADAEMLVASPSTRTLGNWPLERLLSHLATAMNASLDGISFRAVWYMRLIGPLVKGRLMRNGLPSGFRLPQEVEPDAFPAVASQQAALELFRAATRRLQTDRATSVHPLFGKVTHDEWLQLHLRHAELHLSFAVPA